MSLPEHAPMIDNSELFANFLTNEGMEAVFSLSGDASQAHIEEPLPALEGSLDQLAPTHINTEPLDISGTGISQESSNDAEYICTLNPHGEPLQDGEYYTTLSPADSNSLLGQLSHDERRQQDLSEVIGVMSRQLLPTDALITNLIIYESNGKRKCPMADCGKVCNRPRHAIDHILAVHLKIRIRCLLWLVQRPI
jgi:hypothetical protein